MRRATQLLIVHFLWSAQCPYHPAQCEDITSSLGYSLVMRVLLVSIFVISVGCASGQIDAQYPDGGTIISDTMGGRMVSGGECSPGERRCSSEAKTQTCRDDGTWATPRSCVRAMCVEGVCKRDAADCADACSPGAQQCVPPTGIQDCRRGDDGCGQWTEATACPNNLVCDPRQNKCVEESCQSVCTIDNTQCSGQDVMTCIRQGECPMGRTHAMSKRADLFG